MVSRFTWYELWHFIGCKGIALKFLLEENVFSKEVIFDCSKYWKSTIVLVSNKLLFGLGLKLGLTDATLNSRDDYCFHETRPAPFSREVKVEKGVYEARNGFSGSQGESPERAHCLRRGEIQSVMCPSISICFCPRGLGKVLCSLK